MNRHSCIVENDRVLLCGPQGREERCYSFQDYSFTRDEDLQTGHTNAAMVIYEGLPVIIGGAYLQYVESVETLRDGRWRWLEALPLPMEGTVLKI